MGASPNPREPWPPPPSRYRSKACLGAMFFSKAQEEAGYPPICVGIPYRKTSEAPGGSFTDNDGDAADTTDKLGAFKFTCVGYGQRAFPYYPREEDADDDASGGGGGRGGRGGGGGRGGAVGGQQGHGGNNPPRKNHLPYCEGLQILVADKVLPGGAENNNRTNDEGEGGDAAKRRKPDDRLQAAFDKLERELQP